MPKRWTSEQLQAKQAKTLERAGVHLASEGDGLERGVDVIVRAIRWEDIAGRVMDAHMLDIEESLKILNQLLVSIVQEIYPYSTVRLESEEDAVPSMWDASTVDRDAPMEEPELSIYTVKDWLFHHQEEWRILKTTW